MKVVYQDEYFVVIDKPPGFFVHPPERSLFPPPRERICVYMLREELGRAVFPVHRLDAPTSGVMIFAFDLESTRALSRLFADREMKKSYEAVARGFVEETGTIEIALESRGGLAEALTRYHRLAQIELPAAVGTRYSTARYSLVEARPLTGRWHQIRRHFDRIAHPLLGDIDHGDSHHNRFFRDQLGLAGLCLRAMSLEFVHPWSKKHLRLQAPECARWQKIHSLFAYSPSRTQETSLLS